MKISIITVCFNAKATIADAMESVAKQRVENVEEVEIEHIVVDGGSTDGTVEIIREFANNQVKVRGEGEGFAFRWISEKDNGLYDAMNKGIKMATGWRSPNFFQSYRTLARPRAVLIKIHQNTSSANHCKIHEKASNRIEESVNIAYVSVFS